MNGVLIAISVESEKVLGTPILSKNCKGCVQMKAVKNSDLQRYKRLKMSHKGGLNFKGSSPVMEEL